MTSDKGLNVVSDAWSWWWDGSKIEDRVHRLAFTIFIALLLVFWYKWAGSRMFRKRGPPLPPGPRGLPLVGSLPFLEADVHLYFTKLAKIYGPIIKLRMGGKVWVVVSSPSLAKEVLRDHDATFANRDVPIAGLAVTYGGLDIVWSPHGPMWRMLRKVLVREMLTNANLEACYGLRQQAVHQKMKDLYAKIGTPLKISEQVFQMTSNVIMSMLWGNEVKKNVGAEFQQVVTEIVELLGKPNVSDIFPVLARFDIQGIERRAKELLSWFDKIFDTIIQHKHLLKKQEQVQKETDSYSGNGNQDFLQILLELIERRDPKMPFTIMQLKGLFMDIVVGGTDSTSTTVEWALAEMMQHPDVMRKAQEELEQVVGLNSMVHDSHLSKLHYLSAVLKETLRLHPAVALLVPHSPSEACTIGGYTVPKGATMFFNVWAIQRDPQVWEDPLVFCPDRFMRDGNKYDYQGNDFRYLPFGSGRRICAGIPLAERMLIYVLASLVHSFEWRLPEGSKLDFSEKFGIVLKKSVPLVAVPTTRLLNLELYK